ncbi:MAG: GAF domain-containing protein [Candidatus Melainabacteria bacterium]
MRSQQPEMPTDSWMDRIICPLVLLSFRGEILRANEAGSACLAAWSAPTHPVSPPLFRQVCALEPGTPPQTLVGPSDQLRLSPVAGVGVLLEWFPLTQRASDTLSLHILQEVSEAVNSSLILEDIFESLGDVLGRYLPFDEAVIIILDDTQNGVKLLVRFLKDGGMMMSGENNTFAGYDPVIDQTLRSPAPRVFHTRPLPHSVMLAESAQSALVVPLINKGLLIGLIALSDRRPQLYSPQQVQLLQDVSVPLAVAVENAKFYWQSQSQASREYLINQLTKSIRESLDIDTILQTAVKELGQVTGVSRCRIRYFAREDTPGRFFDYLLPGTAPLTAAFPADFEDRVFHMRQLDGGTAQAMNPFVLNDVRDCPPTLADPVQMAHEDIHSLAVFPIRIQHALVGSITLHQCGSFRVWVAEDIELLGAIAEHLAVALHQAQLFTALDTQRQTLANTLEELQQAQMHLIQSEKMAVLGQFVAGIAHEVNTPLGTILANNDTLKRCLDKLPDAAADPARLHENMADLLALNQLAGERIQDIVKNLRNFARLDESEMKTVNLHEGIDSTLLIMKGNIPSSVTVDRQYDPDLPAVPCYPGLLNQVFMNLLVNAVHAMAEQPAGRITISTAYHPETRTVGLVFADTGKGIPPENLGKVFDPGFTTKGVGVGTGLGLALCYRIVEKHGGQIAVESTVGDGTRFSVSLPLP